MKVRLLNEGYDKMGASWDENLESQRKTAMLGAQVFYVISIIYIFIGDTLGILRMLSSKKRKKK